MDKKIIKIELDFSTHQTVKINSEYKILKVTLKYQKIVIFALVNPNSPVKDKTFTILETGELVGNDLEYLDTVILVNGFEFHIFQHNAETMMEKTFI